MARRAAVSIDYPYRPPPPPGESMILSNFFSSTFDGMFFFCPAATFDNTLGTTGVSPDRGAFLLAKGGKARNLYVNIDSNNGGTGTTVTVLLNGVATSLVVTIPTGSTSGTDLTDIVTCADGDSLSLHLLTDTDCSKIQESFEFIANA